MALTKTRDYVSVGPTSLPLFLVDIRQHIGLSDNHFDSMLDQLLSVATTRVEQDTRRSLITQTRVLSMDSFPTNGIIELPSPPLQSVTSVTYVDTNDATQTFSSSKYSVDSNNTPGRLIVNDSEDWPTIRGHFDDIKVTYVAGYGSTVASVDPVAQYAIKMLVSHLFNSPAVTAHGSVSVVPVGYESLINSLKWGQYP